MNVDLETHAHAAAWFSEQYSMPIERVFEALADRYGERCYWCETLTLTMHWMETDGPIPIEAYFKCTKCGRMV